MTALVTTIKVNITCSHCKSYFGCLMKSTTFYLSFYFILYLNVLVIYTNIILLFGIYLIYEIKIKGVISYVKGKFQKKGM